MIDNDEYSNIGQQRATEHLGLSLLEKCLEEMKAMPHVWQKMTEAQQHQVLERLKLTIEEAATTSIAALRANGSEFVPVHIDQLNVKKDTKLTLSVSKCSHELIDHVSSPAILVLESPKSYLESMSKIKADADQTSLDIGDDNSGKVGEVIELDDKQLDQALEQGDHDPLYEQAVKFVRFSKKTNISSLQRGQHIGYNRAARLIEAMEQNGVLSEPDKNGQRTIL